MEMELHTVVVNGGQLFRNFLEGNDAKNSQMNSMISAQKSNSDTCDQWSFWRTCSSRSSMFFLAGGVPSFRRWKLHRRSATEVKTDERHARGKACWRSFRAMDIRYCKRLLSFWVVQLDYAIEEVWNAAMAICI